jgi:chromosome segregation ATPase
MMLKRISARNIKGQTFEYVLSRAVAIVGMNFEGKSAITDAIRLVCLGHLPEVGKVPAKTWELSSGQSLVVCAQFDDGSQIKREFVGGKSGVSIGSEMIVDSLAEIPLLDAEHYFGLTDTQRTDYVFDRIRLPEVYSIESIWADLKRLNLGEKHTEAVEKAHREILDDLNKFFGPGAEVQAALGDALESLRDKFSYWNRRAKETQGAVTTLTELKVREKNVVAAPANLGGEIAAARKELDRINTEKGRVTGERDAAERNEGRRKMLQKELDKDRIDYPRMLTKKQEEKEALEKELVAEPSPEEIEEARRTIASANSVISIADGEVSASDKMIGQINGQLEKLAEMKECPTCKAKGKGWKNNVEAELNQRIGTLTGEIGEATKRRDKALGELHDANETLETLLRAQEKNHRLREQIRQIEREVGNIQTDQRSENEKRERYQAEIKELKAGDVRKLNHQISSLEQERSLAAETFRALQEKQTAETRLQQDLLRATEAEQEHQDAKAHKLIVTSVADFIKDKREAIICEAFTKLLQVANMVVKSILKSPLVLHDNTIGRFAGAKFVPHRVFSGTEKVLTYVAIATALSIDAPLRMPIIDEIGRLHSSLQASVISRLLHLVNEKIIDQFIVIAPEIPALYTEFGLPKPTPEQENEVQLIHISQ